MDVQLSVASYNSGIGVLTLYFGHQEMSKVHCKNPSPKSPSRVGLPYFPRLNTGDLCCSVCLNWKWNVLKCTFSSKIKYFIYIWNSHDSAYLRSQIWEIWSPCRFLLGGGRQRLKYGIFHKIWKIWQPYSRDTIGDLWVSALDFVRDYPGEPVPER